MKKIVTLFVVIILHLTSMAQPVRVAAAANLQTVIKVLQQDFKKRTGIEITPIIGSSGNLVAQLKNGAPFDLFLSADMAFADALYQDNLTTARPVVYAMGSLVICSTQNYPCAIGKRS
jgi:molybdate transport system substrate-binding protein